MLTAALTLAPLVMARADGRAAPPPPPATAVAPPARLDGLQLYLAQVLAQLGAESLIGAIAVCPPASLPAVVVAPATGVLAADWVGREMGLVAGSQLAALVGNYLLACTGLTAVTGGALFTYVVAVVGISLSVAGGATGTAIAVALAAGGVTVMAVGALVLVARPFFTPLLWSLFAADEGSA